eukprot:TRINITY_DN14364_c0_g1_i1.p1 TRINITY_DN14364_c0_g1~~TRINITY_DN14364_c0_g1_i1.p1  ORF type:complete len:303 (+),score=72.89 TRINITY_DN14364_c0_g1_i1:96-1004(+)
MSITRTLSTGKLTDLFQLFKNEKPEVANDDIIKGFEKNVESGLFLLSKGSTVPLFELIEGGHRAGVCYAVDKLGTCPNSLSTEGRPAVVAAAKAGKTEILTSLLERGADPKKADPEGNTAAHVAAELKNAEALKTLALFKSGNPANKAGKTPTDISPLAKDLTKAQPEGEKAEAMALKFKAQGNKVFAAGEYVKASKLYTIAIAYSPNSHVFYSNRSACHFNLKRFDAALTDATRAVSIDSKWTKGYFRLGSSLAAMGLSYQAMEVYEAALAIDSKMSDIKKAKETLAKEIRQMENKFAKAK